MCAFLISKLHCTLSLSPPPLCFSGRVNSRCGKKEYLCSDKKQPGRKSLNQTAELILLNITQRTPCGSFTFFVFFLRNRCRLQLFKEQKLFMSRENEFIPEFSFVQRLSELDHPRRLCVLQMFQTAQTMSLCTKQLHTMSPQAF